MSATAVESTDLETVEDLVHRLGDVPLWRIRMRPPLGTATVADLVALAEGPNRVLCELIEGNLVEKDMGALEAHLALRLGGMIEMFLEQNNLGIAFGADGPFQILPNRVRLPDVSVFLTDSLPDGVFPKEKVPALVPDLVVEILSEGNTKKEIEWKLEDYFSAGVQLVWVVRPTSKSAQVYTSPTKFRNVEATASLTGDKVLPGFELPLANLFARIEYLAEDSNNE